MNFKKIIFTLTIILLFHSQNVMAVKMAVFPDSSKLQPIPTNVQPNISGNINSHVSQDQVGKNKLNSVIPSNSNKNNPGVSATSQQKNNFAWLIFFVIIIICTILFLYAIKKKNGRMNK